MRIEYEDPKLEIIDLLDADIVTSSPGDNDIDVGGMFGGGGNDDDDWNTNDDDWTGYH